MDDFSYNADASIFATVGHGVDYTEMNKGVRVAFETVWEPKEKPDADGNMDGYSYDVVHIFVVGDNKNVSTQPMDAANKERFAQQYAEWKRTKEVKIDGVPLEEWPLVTKKQVSAMRGANFRTVEDLSNAAEETIRRAIPDGLIWKAKATSWLKANKDAKHAAHLAAENERMKSQLANMQERLDEMAATVRALQPEKNKAA